MLFHCIALHCMAHTYTYAHGTYVSMYTWHIHIHIHIHIHVHMTHMHLQMPFLLHIATIYHAFTPMNGIDCLAELNFHDDAHIKFFTTNCGRLLPRWLCLATHHVAIVPLSIRTFPTPYTHTTLTNTHVLTQHTYQLPSSHHCSLVRYPVFTQSCILHCT